MNLNLRQMAEIAALVSAKSTLLIESPVPVSEESLHAYWTCARGRTIDWIRQLDSGLLKINTSHESEHGAIWESLQPVLTEVLVTEILTRVWGATLTAMDRQRGIGQAEPVATRTTDGHMDARNRAMRLLINGPQIPLGELARVDKIRRKAERWTDLLVGHLALKYNLEQFTFESRRALEFGQSQMRQAIEDRDEPVWEFVLAGVRMGFSSLQSVQPLSDTWNRGLVKAILGAFPQDSFNGSGLFQSLDLNRIQRSGLAPETPVSDSRPDPVRPPRSRFMFSKLKQQYRRN